MADERASVFTGGFARRIVRAVHLVESFGAGGSARLHKGPRSMSLYVGGGGGGAAGGGLAAHRIDAVEPDWLRCRAWDGEAASGEPVRIAKPWTLRASGWRDRTRRGITYTDPGAIDGQARTAEGSEGETEDQIILPRYAAEDILYAARVAGGVPVYDRDGNAEGRAGWIDVNTDGRAWARDS